MSLNRRSIVPLWLLGLFTFSGTLGMHVFVPALPRRPGTFTRRLRLSN